MSRAARFGAVLATLWAAHDLGDHVLQTDHQAAGKAGPGAAGWRAMAGHVGSYHAAQVAALAVTDRALGLGLRPGRVAVAVALSASTHAFLDRRWPVRRALELTGSPGFARGTAPLGHMDALVLTVQGILRHLADAEHKPLPLPADVLDPIPVPLHGPYLADQSLHHAVLWVAALIASGGAR